MKKLLSAACALLFGLAAISPAFGQVAYTDVDPNSGARITVPVTPSKPLPTTGSGGGGGSLSATASATPTPVVAGVNKPINIDLFSQTFSHEGDSGGGDATDATNHAVRNLIIDPATGNPLSYTTASPVVGTGTAGSAAGGVLTVQGVVSMTAIKVDPSAVTSPVSIASLPALPANQSTNEAQINGVTPLMGNGVSGTGSQRVNIASDNTAFPVNGTLQTQTDTVMVGGVNVKEINAVTPLMGNGVTGTGSQRVTIASDNTAFSVNSVQSGTWTVQPGNTANTTAWKVDGSAVTQPISGSLTNISGTVSLPTGAATAALQPTNAGQASTTSGQTGPLVQCAATTAAPAYTTAQTNPLNCDTHGQQRALLGDTTGTAIDFTQTVAVGQIGPYPSLNTAGVVSSGVGASCSSSSVAAAIATCTIAAVSGKTNYLRAFIMTSDGATTASGVVCTITGLTGGTINLVYDFGVLSAQNQPMIVPFGDLSASAPNTAIVGSCPSGGTGAAHATLVLVGITL